MKKSVSIFLVISFVLLISCRTHTEKQMNTNDLQGKITISGAFALYPLTVKWAEEFKKVHPKVSIDISAGGAGKGMVDVLSGMVDLAMFSREILSQEKQKGAWGITVAKDAVFPTVNASNPVVHVLMKKGLTPEQCREIYTSKTALYWKDYLPVNNNIPIHVFTRSDACGAAATWAAFLGKQQEDLYGTGVFGDPGIADAVKKDPLGIGFNNLVYIYNAETGKCIDGLKIIPLDINGNRQIDDQENFYSTLKEANLAILQFKYPSPPARELYLVSKGIPSKPVIIAFLKYILYSGQELVKEAGYVQLDSIKLNDELSKLEKI